MSSVNFNFKLKTEALQTPKPEKSEKKKSEPRHSRQPSLNMPTSPRNLLSKMKITAEKAPNVHQTKVERLIDDLADGKDVRKKARNLVGEAGGNPDSLTNEAAAYVKSLTDDQRAKVRSVAHATLDRGVPLKGVRDVDVQNFLKAVEAAAAPDGQAVMNELVTRAEDPQAFADCCRSLEKIIEERTRNYGNADPELEEGTGKPLYLAKWTESVVADCSMNTLLALFDRLAAQMRGPEGMNSKLSTAIQDAVVPRIVSEVAEDILHAVLKGMKPGAADDRFLVLAFLCQDSLHSAVDKALSNGAYSKPQMQQMLDNLRLRDVTIGSHLGDRIEACINLGPERVDG
jgi:hypothetical protein